MEPISGKSGRCLAVMVRDPEPGKVKTRLAGELGDAVAAELYGCFVDDLLDALLPANFDLSLFFTPAEREGEVRQRFGGWFPLRPQRGAGLGERMGNVFADCFGSGAAAVVLIGSDCPDLIAEVVEGAFASLEGGCDAVVGPALDGGYYLIGFRGPAFDPAVFDEMAWGTGSVFEETLGRLRGLGLRIARTPAWRDMDTPEDLADLAARHGSGPFSASRTMTLIRKIMAG